jgi:ribose transport system permease protein
MTSTTTSGSRAPAGIRSALRKRAADLAPVGALLLLMIVFTVADRQFLTWGNFRGVFDQSAVPLVLGVGMTYVILLGAIDLSLEGILVASSLAVALLVADKTNSVDIGMFPALVVGILIGTAMGFVNGFVNTRFKIPSFMVTLGMWSIGLGIGQILFGNVPPRIENEVRSWGSYGNNPFRWFGVTRLFYLALAVVLVGYFIQRWTRLGRYAYAIGGNEELARQSGINVARYKTFVFMFAGGVFGLAGGMLLTRTGVGDLRAAQGFLFLTIAGVVIGGTLLMGGRGGVLHSSVGIFIMVVLNNGMVVLGVSQFWQDAVAGFIVVAAVVITGLASRRRMRVVP